MRPGYYVMETSPSTLPDRFERGYCAIGIADPSKDSNVGTVWRSAAIYGAAFMFTTGGLIYRQRSDTIKAWRHVPLFSYDDVTDLKRHLPVECPLVGIEMDEAAKTLPHFVHPERACYLLGNENRGLTGEQREACDTLLEIPAPYRLSLNVATAGTIVLYDRWAKQHAG